MLRNPYVAALVALGLAQSTVLAVDDAGWPRWRGPQDHGSVAGDLYPTRWSADQVSWKAGLPGKGCSTPIVWKRTIYVTAPSEGRDALLAFDWSGKRLWETRFGKEYPGKHRNGSGSNASPATDGEGVFVYFKSGTLSAVELDGAIRWQTNLVERYGRDTLFWDHGTSPVLTRDCVVMARMHNGESWLAAFDKQSGELRWKVARNYETPTEGDHGYSTPLVIDHEGTESLLVWGAQHVTIHDAADGSIRWSCGGFNPDGKPLWPVVASPVVVGDLVVMSHGRNDRGDPRLYAVRLAGRGDVTATQRQWERTDTGTFVPTPAVYQGKLYLVRDRGQVECLDPVTGRTEWLEDLPPNRSAYYASPLVAGGNLYAIREDGMVFVCRVAGGFELLSEIDMQERIIASPVPAEGRLFIRGERNLFCIGSQ